jgi:alpha-beta hydrolase superfamily lysophospholipase
VVQGQSDQTVDWKYNMQILERLFEPEVLYIPEARHHLVNESAAIRAQIFAAIDAELDR